MVATYKTHVPMYQAGSIQDSNLGHNNNTRYHISWDIEITFTMHGSQRFNSPKAKGLVHTILRKQLSIPYSTRRFQLYVPHFQVYIS